MPLQAQQCAHGRACIAGNALAGLSDVSLEGAPHSETFFVFPVQKPVEEWPAGPFIFIDQNKRPYVLTRLKDREAGTWEYTRYRAEANSVIGHDTEEMLTWVSAPTESEYEQPEDTLAETVAPTPEDDQSTQPVEDARKTVEDVEAPPAEKTKRVVMSFSEAIEAIRVGEFEAAIPFLERLVRERPNYHIGWLRLGYAQRERAARFSSDRLDEAVSLLNAAMQSFTQALGHVDVEYRASAFYERSKTHYRKYVVAGDRKDAESAHDDAKEARVLSSDSQYQSWIEYLERLIARSVIQMNRSAN